MSPSNGGPQTNGGTTAVTANNSPVVTAPADKTIPTRTPFTLTGSATDSNGDTLTYLWEQTDVGGATGTGLVDNNKTNGPLFRVFGVSAQVSAADTLVYNSPGENLAGTDPSRTFPDLPQILAGNTNAAIGHLPGAAGGRHDPHHRPGAQLLLGVPADDGWVGTGDRVLHFRLTARDEFTPDAGGRRPGRRLVGQPGPHRRPGGRSVPGHLTGHGGLSRLRRRERHLERRRHGGRRAGAEREDQPVDRRRADVPDCPVGHHAERRVAGRHAAQLTTTTARIKVEAVGNYFFDINDANFSIPSPQHVGDGLGRYAGSWPSIKARQARAQEDHRGSQVQGEGHRHHGQWCPNRHRQVYKGSKLLGTGTLKSNGKVTIKISAKKAKKLKVGKNTLTAKYLGSATVAASQVDFKIKVVKKK